MLDDLGAAQQAFPRHLAAATNRRSGWLLTGAYALNAPWSVATQGDKWQLTPAILPSALACTAAAYSRLQEVPPEGPERLASASTGLLLGWISLAAAVNVVAGTRFIGVDPTAPAQATVTVIGELDLRRRISTLSSWFTWLDGEEIESAPCRPRSPAATAYSSESQRLIDPLAAAEVQAATPTSWSAC